MHSLLKIFSSLKLTLLLLTLSLLLVFFGTLDQVNYGVFEIQRRYFQSLFVLWYIPGTPLPLPLPGGYLLGSLLLLNLAAAHFKYFQKTWKKSGIILIHLGLTILIISGFLTSALQEESQMWLELNKDASYSSSINKNELVLIDKSSTQTDTIFAIPTDRLKNPQWITLDSVNNIRIRALKFLPNADLGFSPPPPPSPLGGQNLEKKGYTPPLANQGVALKMNLTATPKPISYKDNEANAVSAYVEVQVGNQSLGTWLVSNIIDDRFPPQTLHINNKPYEIALRFKRTYFPFSFQLLHFTHEKYPGSEIPKHFSSNILLKDPTKENRNVLIYMNNPLRHQGYTFYQASFEKGNNSSMLQVVKNPSRILPYIAIILIASGMLFHFLLKLTNFLNKKS